MFTDIQVFSRAAMIDHTAGIHRPCVIVSISDKDVAPPEFYENHNIWDVCQLFFDDEEDGPTAMTRDDAQTLVDFVKSYENEDIDIFFHCNGGVSRSAGCAAAVMLMEWGCDADIFNDGRYCPNMHCYRYVLDASGIDFDDIEVAKKQKRQFDLWCIEHADELYGD